MQPIYLTRSEINSSRWDSFMEKSMQRVVYGFSWYLDIVSESWGALVWPSQDDFQIVMPLPIKSRLGFKILYQPHFCQYLGLFSSVVLTQEHTRVFLLACSQRFKYISTYSFHPSNTLLVLGTELPLITYQANTSVWLSMDMGVDQYTKDRVVNLLRAKKWSWQLEEHIDIQPLINLFRQNHMEKIPGGVADRSFKIFNKLYGELRRRDIAKLIYAYDDKGVHAGILIVQDGPSAIYLFNAADAVGRKGNARTLILNEYFEANKLTNLIFDFESPGISSIHQFYKSFGGEEVHLMSIRKLDLRFPWKQLYALRRWLLLPNDI